MKRLTVVRPGVRTSREESEDTFELDEFATWLRSGRAFARLGRYDEARMLVHRVESIGRPLPLALALRALSHGTIYVEDAAGRRASISAGRLASWTAQLAAEPLRVRSLLRRTQRDISALKALLAQRASTLDLSHSPVFLRTDLSFGIRAGGSVGHIAGVLNALSEFTGPPVFLTTDDVPTVRSDIETHLIAPDEAFWNFRELPTFVLNRAVDHVSARAIGDRPLAFVYQRYSLNNYAGIRLARARKVPFVVEYNGSEVWMSRYWGRRLKYARLAEQIEQLVLDAADLIVVVSDAMEAEIVARGVDRRRVLVNFNGVDEVRYNPDVEGASVRNRFGIAGKTVVGFIGTFGPWHGAEVLAEAFVRVLRDHPELRGSMRLMMIGDGVRMASVRQVIATAGVEDAVVFTGLVPQDEGPAYLAACDVLVSPHVPNPDGTPFFGSPTKLFEYMAMGKAIVASRLDQIADVLDHGVTAWLVAPGDPDALADGVTTLIRNEALRRRLGESARRRAVERHTWRQHTRRTIDRLREISARETAIQ